MALTFGTLDKLQVTITWSGPKTGLAADVTRGWLTLAVAGHPIWGGDADALEWTWIELVEFLATAWPYLVVEQSCPSPLNPTTIFVLEDELTRALTDDPSLDEESLRGEVLEFLETHDLSHALQGITVEPVRLLRRGALMEISTRRRTAVVPREYALGVLTEVGNAIADRLTGLHDERASLASTGWSSRWESVTPDLVVKVGAGLDAASTAVVSQVMACESMLPCLYDSEILAATAVHETTAQYTIGRRMASDEAT